MRQRCLSTLVICLVCIVSLQAQVDGPHGQVAETLGDGSPGDFGAAVGGDLLKHRNSYFFSLDRQAFDWSRLGMPANTSLLSAFGKRPVASSSRSLVLSEALGRFDHRFTQRDTVDLSYNRFRTSSKEFAASAFNAEGQMSTIDNAFAISPTTLNETRGQITTVNVQLPPGAQSSFATSRRFQVYEADDIIDHQVGRQELRGGGSFLWNQASVALLEGTGGNPMVRQSYRSARLFLHDQWRIGPHLLVTAGVRLDAHKLGPLLGFAWSPGGSRSNVLHGGFGVAYQQIALPAFPGVLEPAGSLLAQSYVEHAHLEFEHQFGERSHFAAGYQHVRGMEVGKFSNRSSYDAINVAFAQQPASWGDYKISYSYADGSAPLAGGWDDHIRRASFMGRIHNPLEAGSGIWDQITHSIALTGYGDFTRQNQLPGVDCVHLDARLSKEVQIGSHVRVELFLQRSGLLQHRSQSMAKLFSHMSSSEDEMMIAGAQVGVRLRF